MKDCKLYFHNDMDGIISAAAYLTMGFNRVNDYDIEAVSTRDRQKFDKKVDYDRSINKYTFLAAVDYRYAEGLNYWCDHHKLDDNVKQSNTTTSFIHDSDARSAGGMLMRMLIENTKFGFFSNSLKERYLRVASDIDMIDSADYPSVWYVFNSLDHIMVLKRYIESVSDEYGKLYNTVLLIVKYKFNIKKVIKKLGLVLNTVPYESIVTNSRDKKFLFRGAFTVYVSTDNNVEHPLRYSEFYYHPEVRFSVRAILVDDIYEVRISKNPWNNSGKNIDIAKYFKGMFPLNTWGGHANIGGGTIKKEAISDFLINVEEKMRGL